MKRYYLESDDIRPVDQTVHPDEVTFYLTEDVEPLVQLIRDYREALVDGPENCSLKTAEALERRADTLLPPKP